MNLYRDHFKRVCDFVFSACVLMTLAIPILLLSLLVLVQSGRPVFFIQERVGRYGRLFKVCKFRTMAPQPAAGSTITVRGDFRITPLGAFLRRWKLDELPQFWNVLKGDMSLVGARPDVPGYMDRLEGEDRRILELRPGITGPATLKYKNEEEILADQANPEAYNDQVIFPDKVRLNLLYYRQCSLGLDVRILLITIGVAKSKPGDFWMK